MRFWLFKSEPSSWSFAEQAAAGAAGTAWTGVRNYGARNFMREMRVGDRGFFYHSNEGKAVVGVVAVIAAAHPDPSAETGPWECVDVAVVAPMPKAVTLEAIKAEEPLKAMVLVNNSRLSVQPVTEAEFRHVCAMGGLAFEAAVAPRAAAGAPACA